MSEKAICRVLDAVERGLDSSTAIAAALGMTVSRASAHLCYLAGAGLVERAGVMQIAKGSRRGRDAYRWRRVTCGRGPSSVSDGERT